MGWEWLLAALGALQPVLLVVLVPRRWLWRAMLAWLALPLPILGFVVAQELAARPPSPDLERTLGLFLVIVGTTYGVAWLSGSALAFAVGLGLRRWLRPAEPRAERPRPPPPAQPKAPRPAWSPGLPAGAHVRRLVSPDGRIGIGIAEVEWAAGQWVRTPRVEDRATGQVLLDLWGSDWDAEVAFPAPGEVWLGLRPFRGVGAWNVRLDLATGTGTIRTAGGHGADAGVADRGPIGDVVARLERVEAAFAAGLDPAAGIGPGRFAAWRSALAILVGAAVAIAALVALTPRPPPQRLQELPRFTPPTLPEPPRFTPPSVPEPPRFTPPAVPEPPRPAPPAR